jgi:hypothetical protein
MFLGLAGEIVAKTRSAGRFTNVRWWGEMVNVLWERGDVAASMNLEDLFDRVSHEQNIAVFCSFLMDNFNGDVHTHMLPRLGDNHSHLIPVEDYGRLAACRTGALVCAVLIRGAGDAEEVKVGCHRPRHEVSCSGMHCHP